MNWDILRHPLNWAIVGSMLLIGAIGGHFLMSALGVEPSKASANVLPFSKNPPTAA